MPKSVALSPAQLRRISKALADPRRFEILKTISGGNHGTPCATVRETQNITAATLSHHLKELEVAGLIAIERQGKCADLLLQRDVLNAYIKHLKSL
jgi:DNA-binding transcriptional ArsR family regulator